MDRTERFYKIDRLLSAGKCLPLRQFQEDLSVSRATLVRDIEYMRSRLDAPLVWDKAQQGYRYDRTLPGADRWNLPGVWFNASEIYALVVVHALLSELGPGLQASVTPLIARLERLLEERSLRKDEIPRRIRVLNVSHRDAPPDTFATAALAVLQRRRVWMAHYNRKEDRTTEREVSPQRLVHYRGTWYLDGWCHLRQALRSFSLDAVEKMQVVEAPIHEIDDAALERFFAQAYGIFTGEATQTAVLRFSPERARWVRKERWHPKQVGTLEADGHYRLEFPYGNDTELVMDILRHGPAVEVVAPAGLRQRVREHALALAAVNA